MSTAPTNTLIQILEAALDLIDTPGNDFTWSSWDDAAEARREITACIQNLQAGQRPEKEDISVLFAPTGPLHELSLSSGWADTFTKLASQYDKVEPLLWKPSED
ncbi:MAG: hypothetical protein CMO55_06765 [Verrucomicrobiales bacterium]|nr:hypothetical protein [Verrucomicrobiales bacterium]